MGKSWVYQRINSGEIPSVKPGDNIKVRREDLQPFAVILTHAEYMRYGCLLRRPLQKLPDTVSAAFG